MPNVPLKLKILKNKKNFCISNVDVHFTDFSSRPSKRKLKTAKFNFNAKLFGNVKFHSLMKVFKGIKNINCLPFCFDHLSFLTGFLSFRYLGLVNY